MLQIKLMRSLNGSKPFQRHCACPCPQKCVFGVCAWENLLRLALFLSSSLDLHCLRLKPKLNCGKGGRRRPQINP